MHYPIPNTPPTVVAGAGGIGVGLGGHEADRDFRLQVRLADYWRPTPTSVLDDATCRHCRHVDDVLAALEQMIGPYGRGSSVRRIPHRLHWLLWLLADLDQGQLLDGDRGKA